jgi:TRAP-type C4-dicarboxylate transport system substrate-binding protein
MKRLYVLVIFFCGLLLPIASQAQTLRVVTPFPENSTAGQALREVGQRVESATGFALAIQRRSGTDPPWERLSSGEFDLAVVPADRIARLSPNFRIFRGLFVFQRISDAFQFIYDEERRLLDTSLEETSLVGLSWWGGELLQLAGRWELTSPAQLHGLRMATRDGRFRHLGAEIVPLPPSEFYTGLQRGVVETVECSLATADRLREVLTTVTLTNHRFAAWVLVADRNRWRSLDPDTARNIRSILREAGRRLAMSLADADSRREESFLESGGVNLRLLDVQALHRWRDAVRPLNAEIAETVNFAYDDLVRDGFQPPHEAATAAVGAAAPTAAPPPPPSMPPEEVIVAANERPRTISAQAAPPIFWNGWSETPAGRDVRHLLVNHHYRFNLDLSRYIYDPSMSSGAAAVVLERLQREGQISLLLRPVLAGGNLAPPPGMPLKPKLMTIMRDRLDPAPGETEAVAAFGAGNMRTSEFAAIVNLGTSVSWDVVAREAGCGTITVSVWDSAGLQPLDHLVFSLPVANTAETATEMDCAHTDHRNIRSGLLALLIDPAAFNAANRRLADAALHIYETRGPERTFSMAVFINRDRYMASQDNLAVDDAGIYAWQLQSALSDYVSEQDQMLDTIRHAHQILRNDPEAPYPFAEVAQELAVKIFSGANSTDDSQARRALRSLHTLLDAREDPIFLVQLISAEGDMIYLPLGLLAARAANPVVPGPFQIVQPMAYAVPPAGQPCFERWAVAIPPELPEARSARSRLMGLDRTREPWMSDWVETHADLIRFFQYRTVEEASDDGGLGLILLAHHSGGYLWFNRQQEPSRVPLEYIRRSFPPGSVALVVACSTSGAAPESRDLVKQLNRLGVDAMIISSLPVDAEFGTYLAIEFLEEVRELYSHPSPRALMEILGNALDRTANCFPNNPAGFREMALEFQVVGQYDLALCPPP